MSVKYRNQNGQETIIAGLTPGGDIEAGAVMTRSGQISIEPLAIGEYKVVTVTFDDPMPDNIYIINIDCTSGRLNIATFNKTVNGFSLIYLNSSTLAQPEGDSIAWTATKTYTVQHAAQNAEDIATLKAAVPSAASASNQLTTKSYVDNADNALDSRLDDIKDVIPTGASISNQLVTKNEASVDSALSSTSEHAVQNKVVKAALDAKQDTLTFDNTPTENSNNPVKSGGVYTTTNTIQRQVNDLINSGTVAKNLLPTRAVGTTATSYGVTFTINSDGSVTANGTASGGQAIFQVNYKLVLDSNNSYLISGGHSAAKFCYVNAINDGSYIKTIGLSTGNSSSQYERNPFIPDYNGYTYLEIGIAINAGQTCTNEVFYPMIRLSSIVDDTYVPYAMSNEDITNKISLLSNLRGLEVVSVTDMDYNDLPFGLVYNQGNASAGIDQNAKHAPNDKGYNLVLSLPIGTGSVGSQGTSSIPYVQLAFDLYYSAESRFYVRVKSGNVWRPWSTLMS